MFFAGKNMVFSGAPVARAMLRIAARAGRTLY